MATAESVSAFLDTNRNCTIQIANMSEVYSLINAKVYTFSGYCCHPPQPTISSNKTGVCAITKTGTARGAVGVLTYDLFHMKNKVCTERIAILFSVPYDYNFYSNYFGIGVIKTARECNETLYNDMYYGSDSSFTRAKAEESGITHKAQRVELRATMSNVGKAIIKLEIHDKLG
ncbi:deep-sea actinoporin Cjtox I-like [Paramisgurnus dabryanus]|uniref:deep-sea actinoporin Cjtox I-like n=1 Tax=Paramisgurnus dabryanus TaxID=90735 RepID=UPI0031F45377